MRLGTARSFLAMGTFLGAVLAVGCQGRVFGVIVDPGQAATAPSAESVDQFPLVVDATLDDIEVVGHKCSVSGDRLRVRNTDRWDLALRFSVERCIRGYLPDKTLDLPACETRTEEIALWSAPGPLGPRIQGAFYPLMCKFEPWRCRLFFSCSSPSWSRRIVARFFGDVKLLSPGTKEDATRSKLFDVSPEAKLNLESEEKCHDR
jgi:hypothetical protein